MSQPGSHEQGDRHNGGWSVCNPSWKAVHVSLYGTTKKLANLSIRKTAFGIVQVPGIVLVLYVIHAWKQVIQPVCRSHNGCNETGPVLLSKSECLMYSFTSA